MMSSGSLLVMLIMITVIPTIFYCLFFLITCPANPFAFFRRRSENPREMDLSRRSTKMADHDEEDKQSNKNNMELVVMSLSLGKDVDCPVCLAVFVEGEELRQLKICKHLFHKGCIDKWLSTHFNCPVCRAFVSNNLKPKEKEQGCVLVSRNVDRHDLWQGLPDSAGLV